MTREEFRSSYRVLPYAVRHTGGLWGRVFMGRGARIYMGGDHLLNIQQPLLQETWQQLYYENILGISVTPTRRWHWYSVYWIFIAVCILLAGAFLLTNPFTEGASLFVWGTLVFPLYYLCVNLYLGQTCSVSIITAVQPYEISALRRIKVANRVLPDVQQVIHSAQVAMGVGAPAPPQAAPQQPPATVTAPASGSVE